MRRDFDVHLTRAINMKIIVYGRVPVENKLPEIYSGGVRRRHTLVANEIWFTLVL